MAPKQKLWEGAESKELNSPVNYNLACCLCRLATPAQNQTPEFDGVIAHLTEASKYNKTKRSTWDHDIGDADGDLAALKANAFYQPSIGEIQTRLELAWSK